MRESFGVIAHGSWKRPLAIARKGLICAAFGGCGLLNGAYASVSASLSGETSQYQLGEFRIESQGFLRSRDDRSTTSTSVFVNPDWCTEGSRFSARLNVEAVTLLTDRSTFTVESADAYVSTSRELIADHQFTLGRRVFDWSVADDHWTLGQWSPRFLWDPIRPQAVGLLGFFYTYESRDWRVLAHVSPVSIPERGFPTSIDDGKLKSSSPDWVAPFTQVSLMGQPVDIRYNLVYPELTSLIVVPGVALSVRHGDPSRDGIWAQASAASMPMNQIDLLLEPELIASALTLNSTIHPRRLRHEMMTLEAGWNSEWFRPWLSISGERPEVPAVEEGWVASSMGPALVTSAGVDFDFPSGNRVGAQWINVQESLPVSSSGGMTAVTPPRYPYKDALKFAASWDGPSKFDYDLSWTYDINQRSSLITADLGLHVFERAHIGLGADFFSASQGGGYIGQFYGNDRVRAKVSYAF